MGPGASVLMRMGRMPVGETGIGTVGMGAPGSARTTDIVQNHTIAAANAAVLLRIIA